MKDDSQKIILPMMMRPFQLKWLLLNLIFVTTPSRAELNIRAFQKVFLIHESYPESTQAITNLDRENSVQLSNRLMLDYRFAESCKTEFAAQFVIREESRARFALRPDPQELSRGDYRLKPLAGRWRNDDSDQRPAYLDYGLDRLLMECSPDWGDIIVGRQAISLGTARFISPNDVILPFNLLALDEDYRPGVDGIRARIPLATMSELDFGLILDGDDADIDPKFFIRSKFFWREADWSLTGLVHERASMLGFGYASQIAGSGVWSEFSHVDVKEKAGGGSYNRASIGAEHYFTNEVYLLGEWHYNGAGKKNFRLLPSTTYAYQEGGVYLLGRNYVSFALSYSLTPLTQIQGQMTRNLEQSSQFVSGHFQYQLAEDWQVKLGIFSGHGRQDSEFGLYPQMAYLELEVYF
ncbi:MAG: hypothetical protein ACOH5I_12565 [Oligoflexus sp.]